MSNTNSGVILSDTTDHCTVCVSIPNNAKLYNNDKIFNIVDYNNIISNWQKEKLNEVYNEFNDNDKLYNVFDYII